LIDKDFTPEEKKATLGLAGIFSLYLEVLWLLMLLINRIYICL